MLLTLTQHHLVVRYSQPRLQQPDPQAQLMGGIDLLCSADKPNTLCLIRCNAFNSIKSPLGIREQNFSW